jgi:hypothetical protein
VGFVDFVAGCATGFAAAGELAVLAAPMPAANIGWHTIIADSNSAANRPGWAGCLNF